MSEISKLYENVGIEPIIRDNAIGRGYYIEHQRIEEYPPFTAEKQLEVVKMILFSTWWINLKRLQFSEKFDEALAGLINELPLTEEERTQIKEILE